MTHTESVQQIERLINRLNDGIVNPSPLTVGTYILQGAYGGHQVQRIANTSGGRTVITPGFEPPDAVLSALRLLMVSLR